MGNLSLGAWTAGPAPSGTDAAPRVTGESLDGLDALLPDDFQIDLDDLMPEAGPEAGRPTGSYGSIFSEMFV